MVDVGGHSMHLYCTGEGGAPTVVMDSGLGGTVLDWQPVQPEEVAGFARVCTYDRAGMGWSEPGAQPRTSQQIVEELHDLLGNAGVQGPYVLVGHSFGGTNVQLYASQYPNEVAGMVLVDSATEDGMLVTLTEALQGSPVTTKILATIGMIRLPYTLGGETDERTAISSHRKHYFAVADETSSWEESFEQRLASPLSLGDKPLIVLTAGAFHIPPDAGIPQEQIDPFLEAHSEFQADLPLHSQNSEQIIAEDSGHYIHLEQPDVVIDAIREVLEAARNGSSV
jgi:pimeloyl-ACP methyl ester carboxylesterase